MVEANKEWMLVRFQGTYTSASPSGVRGAKVVKPFDVRVKMHKRFLQARGLRGAFDTYYKSRMKAHFRDMINLDNFVMVEATELDGSKINNPKAMSHADAINYIRENEYPINIALFDDQQLRHEIVLYEKEKKLGHVDRAGVEQNGQQKNQNMLMQARGGQIAVENQINEIDNLFEVIDPSHEDASEEHHDLAAARQAVIDKKNDMATKTKQKKHEPTPINAVTAAKAQKTIKPGDVEEVDHADEEQAFGDLFSSPTAS